MNRTKLTLTAKYLVYIILLTLLYVLQTTPGLFVIFGAKPMLVVPAAIAIAMCEGEFVGGWYGAFAGLLCDIGGSMLFGFNGLLLTFFCVGAGLLVAHLMHCNFWNAMLFTLIAIGAIGSLEFLFGYGMWRLPYVWMIYVYRFLPMIAYTTVVAPLPFWLMHGIFKKMQRMTSN